MRYLYFIVGISVSITILVVLIAFEPSRETSEYAIKINGRIISQDEFDNRTIHSAPDQTSQRDVVDTFIFKELLIQEAQRVGIDKEESFRQAIQTFYEQSLSKILLDRKFAEIEIDVSPEELEQFLAKRGMEVSFTLTPVSQNGQQVTDDSKRVEKGIFDSFSFPVKMVLAPLAVGETTKPLEIYGGTFILRLDSIRSTSQVSQSPRANEKIKQMIAEYRKEEKLQKWMDSLRRSADIQINKSLLKVSQ